MQRPDRHPILSRATLLLALIAASTASPCLAAKVYRCGNAFQDQPCPDVKLAEARIAERPAPARETAAPCPTGARVDGARGECATGPGREPQRTAGGPLRP